MDSFVDCWGQAIFLDEEVRQIVLSKHPEVSQFIDRVVTTLRDPDVVRQSKLTKRSRLYYRFFEDILRGKFLVVVVKCVDLDFVSTVYITNKVKEGEVLWRKSS